eukprot:3214016-Amphidinium_carterae.1
MMRLALIAIDQDLLIREMIQRRSPLALFLALFAAYTDLPRCCFASNHASLNLAQCKTADICKQSSKPQGSCRSQELAEKTSARKLQRPYLSVCLNTMDSRQPPQDLHGT